MIFSFDLISVILDHLCITSGVKISFASVYNSLLSMFLPAIVNILLTICWQQTKLFGVEGSLRVFEDFFLSIFGFFFSFGFNHSHFVSYPSHSFLYPKWLELFAHIWLKNIDVPQEKKYYIFNDAKKNH